MKMSRRSFMRWSAAGAVGMGAVGSVHAGESKSDVYVGKGSADDVIPKLLQKMGGANKLIPEGARVVIKPNMSFANTPDMATGTSPEAVRAMARICMQAGAKQVLVCDHTINDAAICREKTGIGEVVKPLKDVIVFNPSKERFFTQAVHDEAKALTRVELVSEIQKADVLISLPTAKSHSAAGVSLGIKGFMGLIRNRGQLHSSMDLHTAIAELLYYVKPSFTIVDASRALLDNGPAGPGTVKTLDTFVGGFDPVAVDSATVSLTPWYGRQFDGTQIKHLKIAAEKGFGNVRSEKISIKGV